MSVIDWKRLLLVRGAELALFTLLAAIPLAVHNPFALGLLTLLAIYGILLVLSLLLIFGAGSGRTISVPPLLRPENPLAAAFLYGALFGIIILPCNAAALVLLLALAATAGGFSDGLGSFLLYGAGVIAPLLILSLLSQARSRAFLEILSRHQRAIRITAGIFMFAIALWYLALLAIPAVTV